MRRFAEFGILPGYEFPTQPATVRLLGDQHEHDPVSTERRFGIAQFQPEAPVYARAKRWRVAGLDTSSPWNPNTDAEGWVYRVCRTCGLRHSADEPRCPRCRSDLPGQSHTAHEYAGFLAVRQENPVLDEEDRFALRNLVRPYPQWDGDVVGRWTAGPGWALRLSRREEVQWINEGKPPSERDLGRGVPRLHEEGKGFLICGTCGNLLVSPEGEEESARGRRQTRRGNGKGDSCGHRKDCPHVGKSPTPVAIATSGQLTLLRLLMLVPNAMDEDAVKP